MQGNGIHMSAVETALYKWIGGANEKREALSLPPGWLLRLATLITRRQYARMPLVILSVGVTEPPPTRRAVYGRRVGAGRISR